MNERPPTNPDKLFAIVTPAMNKFFKSGTDSYMYAWFDFRLSLDNRDAYVLNKRTWWRVSVNQVAHETGFEPGVVRRSLERLEKLGLIEAEFHYRDEKYRDRTKSFAMAARQPADLVGKNGFPFGADARSGKGGSAKSFLSVEGSKNTRSNEDEEFDQFWSRYPRKVSKVEARKAWTKARKLASLEEILKGLDAYVLETKGKETQYIKHPNGWLSGCKWEDQVGSSTQFVELTKMIEERNLVGIGQLTGVRCPPFNDLESLSPKENSARRSKLVDDWLKENKEKLFSSLS